MNKPNAYCELHVHLEGCVWPEHIKRWWNNSQLIFPPPLCDQRDNSSFEVFLQHIRFRYNFLNSYEAYAHVILDYCKYAIKNNICYAEMQINLALIKSQKLSLDYVLNSMNSALDTVKEKPTIRFIIDLPWQFSTNTFQSIINNAYKYLDLGVIGIGMGGFEMYAKPNEVAKNFDIARKNGLKTLCHAGETSDYLFARQLVDVIKPDRIAHANTISNWVEELGEKAKPIDVCLSSNLQLSIIKKLSDHPLYKWIDAGVPFTLSTDDPAIFNTELLYEYNIAANNFSNFGEYLKDLEKHWINAAFDPNAAREALTNNNYPKNIQKFS